MFTGKVCPNCGEKVNIFPVNADGIHMDEVANAVGSTHSLPIALQRSPEIFDPDFELEAATKREMKDVMQEAQLNKVKALAALQAEKLLRAEKALEAAEQGFMPPKDGEQLQQEDQSGFASMSPGIFLQALGGWDPEQREHFLNQLASNPMLALNLSMMMNPGKAGNANPMGMMNPMAMMGGMMQPPTEQAPPVDAATMVTAMISGMQALQEMGGGTKGNDAQMDRLLDKMDDMRKETEALKLQLVEAQNHKSDLNTEDIRHIVTDVMAGATKGKVGLLNGLEEIHAVRDELIGLGIAQVPSSGVDPEHTLEERKLDHQIKMDDRRDKQDHELRIKAEEAEAAKEDAKGAFLSGLFASAQTPSTENDDEKEVETPIDTVRADSRPASVIS
jgi:hypothetical protein